MSLKFELLKVIIHDDCLEVITSKGRGRYLNTFLTSHDGDDENLPGALIVTDARSIKPAVNVTAESALWGVDVKWQWPNEADDKWRAEIKAEYSNGEVTTYQGRNVLFPDCTCQVTGVPAGKNVSLSVILENGSGKRSKPVQLSTKSSDDAAKILEGMGAFTINNGQVLINDALVRNGNYYSAAINVGVETEICRPADEHAPVNLEDCKKRFADKEPMPFGGFPMPKRKVRIHVSGLQQWKYGVVSGAEVRVDIIQGGKCIHSEVFSGKATAPFCREVEVHASFDEIVAVHNRPDLKELKVSAEFSDAKRNEESDFGLLKKIVNDHIRTCLNKELQPGGLLHKR